MSLGLPCDFDIDLGSTSLIFNHGGAVALLASAAGDGFGGDLLECVLWYNRGRVERSESSGRFGGEEGTGE